MTAWWWLDLLPPVAELRDRVAKAEATIAALTMDCAHAHAAARAASAEASASNARAAEYVAEVLRLRGLLERALVREPVTGRWMAWRKLPRGMGLGGA